MLSTYIYIYIHMCHFCSLPRTRAFTRVLSFASSGLPCSVTPMRAVDTTTGVHIPKILSIVLGSQNSLYDCVLLVIEEPSCSQVRSAKKR